MLAVSALQTHRWFSPAMCIARHAFTKHILGMKSEFFRKWICCIMYWCSEALETVCLFRSEMDSYRGYTGVCQRVQCKKVLWTLLPRALYFLLCSVYRTSANIWKEVNEIHKCYTIRDLVRFMFCWPCISKYACSETNLMHYLSSIYWVTIPLHVSGLLVAHHQEVAMNICIYIYICIYVLYVLVDCRRVRR
jgi:hypothetical protein